MQRITYWILPATLTLLACQAQDDSAAKPPAPAVEHSAQGAAGQALYVSKGCMGCHGPGGRSRNPGKFPALAGRSAEYLQQQLEDFKSYRRRNPMMSSVAANLDDADIAQLAVYLSELPE